MPDESTPSCQRYQCKNPTTSIVALLSKSEDVWTVSTCDEHNPLRPRALDMCPYCSVSLASQCPWHQPKPDMTCECCGQERDALPFHSDRYGVTYCQECYDTGCSIGADGGGCSL